MCLGIPAQIESINSKEDLLHSGVVSFGGLKKEVILAYVPDAKVGDYVVVHVGFAISKIDEKEALRVFEYLEELGEIEEIRVQQSTTPP